MAAQAEAAAAPRATKCMARDTMVDLMVLLVKTMAQSLLLTLYRMALVKAQRQESSTKLVANCMLAAAAVAQLMMRVLAATAVPAVVDVALLTVMEMQWLERKTLAAVAAAVQSIMATNMVLLAALVLSSSETRGGK